MGAPTRRIVLEIDEGSDPISGDLADGRTTRRFAGWLELADALQAAIGSAREPDVDDGSTGPPPEARDP